MNVLIIGSGGREHALALACANSPLKPNVFCAPGNGGTAAIADNVPLRAENIEGLVEFAIQRAIDLVIIGPEAPLAAGLADRMRARGLAVFGPGAKGALLESSKAWSKRFMTEAGVPTADFAVFQELAPALRYLDAHPGPSVIKASGLAAGKGVIVADDSSTAKKAVHEILVAKVFGEAGQEVLIEERLTGRELSLIAMVEGTEWMLFPPARDHKRLLDGDRGPNTGGMGAFAPVMAEQSVAGIAETIFPPALAALKAKGIHYQGALYAGVMLTESGAKVLEFNCRFGDPEAQAILPLLKIDLVELILAVTSGTLSKWKQDRKLSACDWDRITKTGSAVTVVAIMQGYPGDYPKGRRIEALPENSEKLHVYHAGTLATNGEILTAGGRVLAITAIENNLRSAANACYEALAKVKFEGIFYRRDISTD